MIWWYVLQNLSNAVFFIFQVGCSLEQYAPLKGRVALKWDGLGDSLEIYWLNSNDNEARAFIQKVNGVVTGIENTTDGYNIDNEGSLVINSVTFQDEKIFRVKALDSNLRESSCDITLFVYGKFN